MRAGPLANTRVIHCLHILATLLQLRLLTSTLLLPLLQTLCLDLPLMDSLPYPALATTISIITNITGEKTLEKTSNCTINNQFLLKPGTNSTAPQHTNKSLHLLLHKSTSLQENTIPQVAAVVEVAAGVTHLLLHRPTRSCPHHHITRSSIGSSRQVILHIWIQWILIYDHDHPLNISYQYKILFSIFC